jgi:hypothetical protein
VGLNRVKVLRRAECERTLFCRREMDSSSASLVGSEDLGGDGVSFWSEERLDGTGGDFLGLETEATE